MFHTDVVIVSGSNYFEVQSFVMLLIVIQYNHVQYD